MAVRIGSARSSYGNTARGDQNGGKEVSTENWYLHSKGWRVFRAKDVEKRKKLAYAMQAACDEKKGLFGYSQPDRLAAIKQGEKCGYDPAEFTEPTNCDCSSLVRLCCYYAGIKPSNFITSNEATALLSTGEFIELTDNKYTTKSDWLCAGDILVTKTKGHTVIVLTNGSKYQDDTPSAKLKLGDRELDNGCVGEDVKELQTLLISLGYSCGSWGADGDFGDETEMAVVNFQRDKRIVADGIVGPETYKALNSVNISEDENIGTSVIIKNGNCYVRTKPNTSASKLGIAYKGTSYVYGKVTTIDGWNQILFKNTFGWVSGKYSSVE